MRLARTVESSMGAWRALNPLTGAEDFSHPDKALAVAVAEVFDSNDPVDLDQLFDAMYAVPPAERLYTEWVMSSATAAVIRKAKDSDGRYYFQPAILADAPDSLLGKPIRYDEAAVGVRFQRQVMA